ncbi:hypothetical protein ACSBR1_034181 [Camellia fascicularis]
MAARDERRSAAVAVSSDRSLDWKAEIGSISSDIKVLQEKSMDMGLKLKNRKVAESKLAKFVEDIIVPPRMIDIIVDGEVNDEYMRTLENLSKKLKFVEADLMVKTSKALRDVQPELERLRQKAVSKVFEFIVQKLYALRKPKTNIQILQQSVLLKYIFSIFIVASSSSGFVFFSIAPTSPFQAAASSFAVLQWEEKNFYSTEMRIASKICLFCQRSLQQSSSNGEPGLLEHGKEVYVEVRAAYIDTMNKVLSAHLHAYIQALEKLQMDIVTSSDMIGVEARNTGLFSRGREPLKNWYAVFALGERINILKVLYCC